MPLDARSMWENRQGNLMTDFLLGRMNKPHPITQAMPNALEFLQTIQNSGYNLLDTTRQAMAGKRFGPEVAGPITEDILNTSVMGAPTALAANRTAGPFYSALKGFVEQSPLNKAPGDQWLGTVKNAPGIKPEELEWTGFQNFLKGKPSVTKQEAVDFLESNKVDIQEVVKGEPIAIKDGRELAEESGLDWDELPDFERRDFNFQAQQLSGYGNTKFPQYQLPGGENYKEMALTLPKANSAQFISPHDFPDNTIAHVRFNDRVDANGKKTLFLEEIQSDWHQKGRKQGYEDAASEARKAELSKEFKSLTDGFISNHDPSANRVSDRASQIYDEWKSLIRENPVPDAPFKTSWPDLSLKRMIKYAVDNGYDSVSWTPGKVQAERYDLSKQVKSITYAKDSGTGKYGMLIEGVDGNSLDLQGRAQYTESELSDLVGKEVAEKIIKGEGTPYPGSKPGVESKTLSGIDLRVGGEGMKAFYDKMLVSTANKLGKKYGAKVGVTHITEPYQGVLNEIPGETALDARNRYKRFEAKREVWTLPITDAMRKEVGEKGVPLFSGGAVPPGLTANDMGQQQGMSLEQARKLLGMGPNQL
jgi:hypothetical protein